MKTKTRIRQSEAAVRSGVKLVLFFLVVCVSFVLFGFHLLAKISGVLATFFAVVTTLEYWNVWRLKRKMAKEE